MSKRPAFQDWKKVKFGKKEPRVRGEHDFSVQEQLAVRRDQAIGHASRRTALASRHTTHLAASLHTS